ncbi:MAG: hypothetical protein KGI45_00735 [Patescibacteria group bacterium]|nr:hypothetical protein [Patescibacteria group bacterium]
MSSIALATTPRSDRTTRYISAWAEKTIEELKSKSLQFIVLAKDRATSSVFESMLKKHKPSLVFLNGHGGPDLVCGHDDEILVQAGKNEIILKGTITYALSCSSAQTLGPAAVRSGAVAYIGYAEDFIFFISPEKMTRPKEDKTADMFLTPASHIVISLAKGHSTGKATDSAKGYFLKSVQKLISSESSPDDREYMRYLIWDMKNLVCLGDREAVVVR